ncbi:DUF5671 domain-containing protein [Paracoccus marinaquae]|uniref:DUF5671 domain-containing protein n=1 Tax=Paracoccus marinaquae TaxID=2841926 RepID=A0ABS6ALH4_9RHOB|nr:DUF5671 domain-containing protein [Paracoccus marinaquae]MBU3030276.1 hypothetical protein [Paracoccus marinaquae]
MRANDQLSDFVRDGLAAGADRPALRAALAAAGWTAPEIDEALAGWADTPGLPPVPRPSAYVSAREALLYGLLFISLGMVSWHVVVLGFGIIDSLIPDPYDPGYGGFGMRWSTSALIAFLPLFLFLNRRLNREGDESARQRSLARRWVASVTMLVAILVLLGDLVAVVYAFLSGDLTLRFAAKALLVALMGGLVFAYYRDEMDG